MQLFDETNRRLALCISSNPRRFLIGSILISILLSSSLFFIKIEDDIRKSFSPPNSRASREEQIHQEFYNIPSSSQRAFILFHAKDDGTMTRRTHMEEMLSIDKLISFPLNITDKDGLYMCHPLCDMNTPLLFFWKVLSGEIDGDNSTVLDFPVSKLYGHDVFMGSNLFGVQTAETTFSNHSKITHVDSIILWYSFQANTIERKNILRNVTLNLFEMSRLENNSKYVDFKIFGDEIANSEMIRGALEATKLLIVGFFLLIGFVSFVVWKKLNSNQVLWIIIAAVLSPFLAATVSFAIISWLQFPFYSIMCVTPFLILGIGVDDAFIMLQSWCHYKNIKCKENRLATVFVEIGPSISITSVTNMIAFAIGYFTPTPQMSLFCLSTSLACFADFVLTFTLFAPVLYLKTHLNNECNDSESDEESGKDDLINRYSRLICSLKGKILASSLLIMLYLFSTYGVLTMKSTFEPSKAFPSDSPLSNSLHTFRAAFSEFFPLQIIVNRPPNISNPLEYEAFYEMLSSLESLPNSYGRDRTLLFLKAYEKFDHTIHSLLYSFGLSGSEYILSYDNLSMFLKELKNPPFVKMKRDKSGRETIASFTVTIIARNMTEWSNRAVYVDKCRSIVKKYPQLNATIYDGDGALLDLILTVKTDLVGSITVTVLCMAIVCLFFIHDKIGVVVVTFTISSICFTLVGALSWWGADMDPVTMVDVLIATGFSVDYTAHIAYKFFKVEGTPEHRIEQALREMSAPMIQAGISTTLCMFPLIFVPTYAILAFAKTVFLVIALGLIHGIFILPVCLITICKNTGTLLNQIPEVEKNVKNLLDNSLKNHA